MLRPLPWNSSTARARTVAVAPSCICRDIPSHKFRLCTRSASSFGCKHFVLHPAPIGRTAAHEEGNCSPSVQPSDTQLPCFQKRKLADRQTIRPSHSAREGRWMDAWDVWAQLVLGCLDAWMLGCSNYLWCPGLMLRLRPSQAHRTRPRFPVGRPPLCQTFDADQSPPSAAPIRSRSIGLSNDTAKSPCARRTSHHWLLTRNEG
ncbi:hypothetical protein GQ53DRAFT_753149 [Thozetella sp. PMI_491]|nr:hypothetical protein GQ53DRAFT_753149 [Thozetella sp. PMI_491]